MLSWEAGLDWNQLEFFNDTDHGKKDTMVTERYVKTKYF